MTEGAVPEAAGAGRPAVASGRKAEHHRGVAVMESLRRLDDRFVPRREKAPARALRSLPWVLLVASLAQFAALFTEAGFLNGVVSGLLLSAVLTAFVYRPAGRRDGSG